MKRLLWLPSLVFLIACGETVTEPAAVADRASAAVLDDDELVDCSIQNNNTIKKLTACVTLDGVRAHQAALQAVADANFGIRTSGTPGYDASVAYVSGLLSDAGYDVTVQAFAFRAFAPLGPSTLEQVAPGSSAYIEGFQFGLLTYSGAGDVTAPVTPVDLDLGLGNSSTSGCEGADFAGFPVGHIALLQRGTCTFQLKALNAEAAGAVGVLVFNQGNSSERLGLYGATLGSNYSGALPVLATRYDVGVDLAATPGLVMRMAAQVFNGTALTSNVLAETPGGDPTNVVMAGGHLDSVLQGPGIQDNGSGSAALLEVALQMANTKPRNKVRFAWWGAEESGLIGSDHYVYGLSSEERNNIALYLNFDMIGSPNFVYAVYDGDGSSFGLSGPPGSEAIEELFQNFYAERGLSSEPASISFRSDYAAFFNSGIPFGGLFTGAEGIKTPEQVALYGGTAGEQYDPCYHLACDTYDNISLEALDVNSDAVATAVLHYAMSTESVNGTKGKGNFSTRPSSVPGPRTPAGETIR